MTMKSIFSGITRLSLRFLTVSLLLALALGVFGLFAVTKLKLELIPPIEFPQTVVLSRVEGMDSDEVLVVLTERLEESFAEDETFHAVTPSAPR